MPPHNHLREPNMQKKVTVQEALDYHQYPTPGKISLLPSKSVQTQRDLSLAYSPGVAYPCLEIHADPSAVYKYTSKGNTVAIISNGTAVLGLGNIGAHASKPVMEGKAILLKKFADIDGTDIEIDSMNTEEIISCIKCASPSWGGINLEDIKAPECFEIEDRLKAMLDIPVFHDDQHGTAIVVLAGLINALELTNKKIEEIKIVVVGAGAAAIACTELLKKYGVLHENVILCDSQGVIYKGRSSGMNLWKERHATSTAARTPHEAVYGADVLIGLSVKGSIDVSMLKHMAPNPILFSLANPDPEITPEEAKLARHDAIIATGRSDYPNQINNVLAFPYIFRAALDTRSSQINDEMKIAAARAVAELARLPVHEDVVAIYPDRSLAFGPEYIVPSAFDPRLLTSVSVAVAKAAMESGVAKEPIEDLDAYADSLVKRLLSSQRL
jgi:malate dehydrogenase (oxaloacetate-decarboxylating)(NADP+)